MIPRLLERYRKEIVPKLTQEFGYRNVHQVPKLEKIVVNMGVGEATQNAKLIEKAAEELAVITGQKPAIRKARKSIANFKLRARPGDRLHGDAARHAHVGVLRPARQRVAAARARLQGRLAEGLRRARQLLARHSRADHLPRGRVRQGRAASRGSTSRSARPRATTPRARRCSRTSACRSASRSLRHGDRPDRRHADEDPQRGQRAARARPPVRRRSRSWRSRACCRSAGFLGERHGGGARRAPDARARHPLRRPRPRADRRHPPRLQARAAASTSATTSIPRVRRGLGIAVLSTSKGILSDREAREQNVGGELLCEVW